MPRKILERVPDEALQQDLEKYRQRAIELGATDAKIIPSDMVLIDERVRVKCINPKCKAYGTNVNCPPYTMDVELVRKIVSNFHYAIFTQLKVAPETLVERGDENLKERTSLELKNLELVSKIEAEAFYDGYHLALGFGMGSCKKVLCPDNECSALISGQGCRHPLRARASMEAEGMDAYRMAVNVGWDIYSIGKATLPSEVPHALILGLVLIY